MFSIKIMNVRVHYYIIEVEIIEIEEREEKFGHKSHQKRKFVKSTYIKYNNLKLLTYD